MWQYIVGLIAVGVFVFFSFKVVRPTERGLIERLGKYARFANPGFNFVFPFIEQIILVNTTERMVEAEAQEIITKDNLNAGVDAQIYFKVLATEKAVTSAVYNVNDFKEQIVALSRTTLRDIIGNLSFKEVNSMRGKINAMLASELNEQTQSWGIQIVRAELKEIQPPKNVQETMNKVLIAENEKTAAIDFATATETKADGEKRAAIRKAEGAAKAIELQAQADKNATVFRADGEAQAIKLVNEAAQKFFVGQAVELKKLETMQGAMANNTKIIASSDQPLMELFSKLAMLKTEKGEKNAK